MHLEATDLNVVLGHFADYGPFMVKDGQVCVPTRIFDKLMSDVLYRGWVTKYDATSGAYVIFAPNWVLRSVVEPTVAKKQKGV
jgi:hypothetical protein